MSRNNDYFDDLDLAKKIYVPVLWNKLLDMVTSLISLAQEMTGCDTCIITMGHVWLLSKLIEFCHMINEKLNSDKLLLTKLIW